MCECVACYKQPEKVVIQNLTGKKPTKEGEGGEGVRDGGKYGYLFKIASMKHLEPVIFALVKFPKLKKKKSIWIYTKTNKEA